MFLTVTTTDLKTNSDAWYILDKRLVRNSYHQIHVFGYPNTEYLPICVYFVLNDFLKIISNMKIINDVKFHLDEMFINLEIRIFMQ